jgi:hypothetical protein
MKKAALLLVPCIMLVACKTVEERVVTRVEVASKVSEVKHGVELASGKPLSSCSFRVATAEHGTHSYRVPNRFGHKDEYTRCMTVKNGDTVTVKKMARVKVEIDDGKSAEIGTIQEWFSWQTGTITGRFTNTAS